MESPLFYKKGWRRFTSLFLDTISDANRNGLSVHFYDEVEYPDGNVGFKIGLSPALCIPNGYCMNSLHWDSAMFFLTMFGNSDEHAIQINITLPNYRKVVELPFFYGYYEVDIQKATSHMDECLDLSTLPLTLKGIVDCTHHLDEMITKMKNGDIFRWLAVGELMKEEKDFIYPDCSIFEKGDRLEDFGTALRRAEDYTFQIIGEDRIKERERVILDEILSNKGCQFAISEL